MISTICQHFIKFKFWNLWCTATIFKFYFANWKLWSLFLLILDTNYIFFLVIWWLFYFILVPCHAWSPVGINFLSKCATVIHHFFVMFFLSNITKIICIFMIIWRLSTNWVHRTILFLKIIISRQSFLRCLGWLSVGIWFMELGLNKFQTIIVFCQFLSFGICRWNWI